MEAATIPEELELVGADWDAFRQMMEDTETDSDLVRIDWLLERIRKAQAEIAENNEIADRRIAMQEDFRQGENAKIEGFVKWATGQIGVLAPDDGKAMKAEYGKLSRTLANGTFGFRQRPDRIEFDGKEEALVYAQENDIKVHRTISFTVQKTDFQAYVKKTGVAEGKGWRQVPGKSELFVKPAK